jgi:hypothetical protein
MVLFPVSLFLLYCNSDNSAYTVLLSDMEGPGDIYPIAAKINSILQYLINKKGKILSLLNVTNSE